MCAGLSIKTNLCIQKAHRLGTLCTINSYIDVRLYMGLTFQYTDMHDVRVYKPACAFAHLINAFKTKQVAVVSVLKFRILLFLNLEDRFHVTIVIWLYAWFGTDVKCVISLSNLLYSLSGWWSGVSFDKEHNGFLVRDGRVTPGVHLV